MCRAVSSSTLQKIILISSKRPGKNFLCLLKAIASTYLASKLHHLVPVKEKRKMPFPE